MIRKILFRADGNSITGLGHLYRLFAVVDMLKDHYTFVFVTRNDSTVEAIPSNFNVSLIPNNVSISNEAEWLAENFDASTYVMIADGYQFNSSYQRQIKQLEFKLVYIDDLVESHMYADIVINHAPDIEAEAFLSETYTKFGLGTKYALLRQSFLTQAKKSIKAGTLDSLFICFGGADKYDLSLKVAIAAVNIDQIREIHIVLGGAYDKQEIYDFKEKHSKKLNLYNGLSETDLVAVMNLCNFAVAPTSTIFYELCAIKMPILGGYYVKNQEGIYNSMSSKNVLYKAGDFTKYTIRDFEDKLNGLLSEPNLLESIQNQKNLFDGKSDIRILGLINSLNISFREAVRTDLELTYEWSNDELVRKNSFNSEQISFTGHSAWFEKKMVDKNSLFLIAEVNDIPAGVVRYEVENQMSIVGVSIQKEFRGQGLATDFLLKSAELYFSNYDKPIFAYIKKKNTASVKAFEKAGYYLVEEKLIMNEISFVYKLDANHGI
ncbi:UDP-2,4-diacetamido-2,4,6-trideoxy-beta-L-altropyranose hydrolase [Zobellia laminariae]|uniref:UDP-2,4-diacetamido-2,4, 6-trideoxy-beta-L-altropyranose hydrolase n=1 Tax=Zobellia laminariae TaxID=248906 RepID=UPI0026F43EC8|nr:UDP-2,4-diacetamido-2,4,6-trideoxy-beta-L-altropyranose hydrolase [Zobellia laminariae]WKX77989.1 UDP-2,4-diacetamido-2,4,6-trideoxy-beta-L-altropyranose hydrolase [Zobellia laminariae]